MTKAEKQTVDPAPPRDFMTLCLLYAMCCIEGADAMLLPATFRALEVGIGLSPKCLAMLSLVQSMCSSMCAPVWGTLIDRGASRKWMLVAGACSWGTLTFLLACVNTFEAMIGLRALNGAALATLGPVAQSIIAGMGRPDERGFLFGWVYFAGNFGALTCAIWATSISNVTVQGIHGWRIAFCIIAALSLFIASMTAMFMKETPRRVPQGDASAASIFQTFDTLKAYWRIDTFRVIVAQGVFGSIPWNAMSFAVMYFQYVGFGDMAASTIFAMLLVGGACGGVFGGMIGDAFSRWSRYHGRPLVAQISVGGGVPCVGLVFSWYHWHMEAPFLMYAVTMFTFGFLASWCAPGVNRPVLTEVVSSKNWASNIAWLTALEGSSAAMFGAPVVGYLAESVFGYRPSPMPVRLMPVEQQEANARALSSAITCCTVAPWIVCLCLYTLLHYTYKADLLAAQDDAAAGELEGGRRKSVGTAASNRATATTSLL